MAMHCVYGGRECDGCMRCQPEEKIYYCPICGGELGGGDDIILNNEGEIVGCENCIRRKEAYEVLGEE